eukprot:111544_1
MSADESIELKENNDASDECDNDKQRNSPYLKDINRLKEFFLTNTRFTGLQYDKFKKMPTLRELKEMNGSNFLKDIDASAGCNKSSKIRCNMLGKVQQIYDATGLPGHFCLIIAVYMHDLYLSKMERPKAVPKAAKLPNGTEYIQNIFSGSVMKKNVADTSHQANYIHMHMIDNKLKYNEKVPGKAKTVNAKNIDKELWPQYNTKSGQYVVTDLDETNDIEQFRVMRVARTTNLRYNANKNQRRNVMSEKTRQDVLYLFNEQVFDELKKQQKGIN